MACAAVVVKLIAGTPPDILQLVGVCYSTVALGYAFSLSGVYQPRDDIFVEAEGGGTSPVDASREARAGRGS